MTTESKSENQGDDFQPISGCTVSELLREAARRFGELPAVIAPSRATRWSFRELDRRADAVAAACIAAGLKPGDRAVIYAFNLPEWVATQYGLARAGVTLVTANTALKREELTYVLRKSQARALFFSPKTPTNDVPGVVASLAAAEVPALALRIGFDGASVGASGEAPVGTNAGSLSFESFVAAGSRRLEEVAAVVRSLSRTDVINMQYTSGTTGSPKGVQLSHANIVENAASVAPILRFRPGEKLCLAVPLFHCFGCVIGTLCAHVAGVALILNEVFHPDAVLDVAESERATAIYGVPTMYVAELEASKKRRRDLSSLRVGVMAGASCPEALVREVTREFPLPGLVVAYGLTEASPGVTLSDPLLDSLEVRATTVGRALPGVEVAIFDPSSLQPLPRGTRGELWTRGPHVMVGYDGEAEATRAAITPDGWLRTGDLAIEREDGAFEIVGRIKELIIRGGENISPAEVENVLRRHPAVLDAAVFGIPSSFFGEDVGAAIRLRPGASATAVELTEFVKARLADHKAPARVWFVEAFPLTGSGKVQRFKLRDQLLP